MAWRSCIEIVSSLAQHKKKGQKTIGEDLIKTNKVKLCANYNQPELATGCCGSKCFIWVLVQTVQIH